MTPWEILWKLPLADGLLYQAQRWYEDGIPLRHSSESGILAEAEKYFRHGR